ncbi:MAG: hypothetical protein HY681_12725 [Chloroflexi bacterium]|nr:hypothetical protein [Chloroflexota bacterium]
MAIRQAEKISPAVREEFLASFNRKALKVLKGRGLAVRGSRTYDWQSSEDSTWRQKVLVIELACDADTALPAWDQLGQLFMESIMGKPEPLRDMLLDSVTFEIEWEHKT